MSLASSLELLAPARNLESGIAAIEHGADAVYIGGPSFGARAAAGNSIADIAALAEHAHRYSARVLLALNTILRDDELEGARRLVWQAFEAGVDALIVQDMGLLELDLPPIQLHASTQCDIRTPQKARFLQDVGFSQIVLARELDLAEISAVAAATDRERCALEFFVHGALCVSFSGQCTISHAFTGRSANRGECSQMCRLPWTLKDPAGNTLSERRHLLSMKDNDQSANLEALIDAGIGSFKIEGRLKDLAYVKNVTAHYRKELDAILERRPELARSSAGRSTFSFEPRPEKTFHRGSTDYFVNGRHGDIGSFESPKFVGAPIGRVVRAQGRILVAEVAEALGNGDGLAWFDAAGDLQGGRVNRVEGEKVTLSEFAKGLVPGATLYRNLDHAFEKQLAGRSAERRLQLRMRLSETVDGLQLDLSDESGVSASARIACDKAEARDPERAATTLHDALCKLGNTMFACEPHDVELATAQAWFVPMAQLNALRRAGVDALLVARIAAWQRPPRAVPVEPPAAYPDTTLNYLGNVFNDAARAFYRRHGVELIEDAFEANRESGLVSLMITKHCVRYSFNLCPKQVKGIRPEPMTLWQERTEEGTVVREPLTLRFDCKRCEMHVVGRRVGGRGRKAPRP
ncbi:MAG TPA: U32 family peptidase [Aromatoleum sp.]|uniref:peptidase U32 family protein n=1 Tax=Aromatoleum sp. TaxID=2307007 RepID=UPI002B4872ED|nr:U32 family peptidase [Aromatoleum sp.]HJV26525.1 U32 family peptidase [Aromatoleum sp.]